LNREFRRPLAFRARKLTSRRAGQTSAGESRSRAAIGSRVRDCFKTGLHICLSQIHLVNAAEQFSY
jgi:hypothetical protein